MIEGRGESVPLISHFLSQIIVCTLSKLMHKIYHRISVGFCCLTSEKEMQNSSLQFEHHQTSLISSLLSKLCIAVNNSHKFADSFIVFGRLKCLNWAKFAVNVVSCRWEESRFPTYELIEPESAPGWS